MLEKTLDPKAFEARQAARWENEGLFRSGRRPEATPYTVMLPPPNVTGVLHMGHALNAALQDILARWRRMQGYDVLWQPGTDHAGIATQMVVERQLMAEGKDRRQMGREAFVARVWDWKAHSGGAIAEQYRRLGASCDWSRDRFTMDPGLSHAVRHVFVTLYRQGLLYRDQRLVNWDPTLETAISDLEVEMRDVEGSLWYFRYLIIGDSARTITVATTRPETMLGDVAVAVHPDDPRYRDLVGAACLQPLTGRSLPIVADLHADPEQGSGAVKITPAHDFDDFEVGRRHGLELINIFTPTATIVETAPERYRGLDRFAARDKVVADMAAQGLLEKVTPHLHKVPYGDRSGVAVEPYLTDQWFVDVARLAAPAVQAVEDGRIVFTPERWTKTYYAWMHAIQPWCVSRQLWWGHHIPAWYGPDGAVFVAMSEDEAHAQARVRYGADVTLRRDDDVLDTWFSSALWPFATLGWPHETPEILARCYPTDALLTGFDIIFFWVARMIMMGLHFTGREPFRAVYIHALVRDENGEKMSKSRGNVIDPLALADAFGADAVRFSLAALAAPGQDIRMATERVSAARAFLTKLWNAARFCDLQGARVGEAFDPSALRSPANRWIVGESARAVHAVDVALEGWRFNDAATAVYRFVWGAFCDWWLEFAKPLLAVPDSAEETRACAGWVLERSLRLLHPFAPFVTEELSEQLGGAASLSVAAWPVPAPEEENAAADAEMRWVIGLVTAIRSARAEVNVPAAAQIPALFEDLSSEARRWLEQHWSLIARLARLESYRLDAGAPVGAVVVAYAGAQVFLPLAGVVDPSQEAARLEKALAATARDSAELAQKLDDAAFLAKAPPAVVAKVRVRLAEAEETQTTLEAALQRVRAIR